MPDFIDLEDFDEVFNQLVNNYEKIDSATRGGIYNVNDYEVLAIPSRKRLYFLGDNLPKSLEEFVDENLRPKKIKDLPYYLLN